MGKPTLSLIVWLARVTQPIGESWTQVSHSKTTATPNSQKHVTRPTSLHWAIFTRCDSDQLAYVKTGNKEEQEQQKRDRLLKNKFK